MPTRERIRNIPDHVEGEGGRASNRAGSQHGAKITSTQTVDDGSTGSNRCDRSNKWRKDNSCGDLHDRAQDRDRTQALATLRKNA